MKYWQKTDYLVNNSIFLLNKLKYGFFIQEKWIKNPYFLKKRGLNFRIFMVYLLTAW